jgi:hypothetical protein
VVVGGIILVAILGAGFFIPALLKAQEFARRAACMKNIQQIGLAMRQYAGDYDDAFMPLVDENGNTVPTGREILPTLPARTGFAVLLKHGYLKVPKALVCPSSADKMPALADDLMKMSLKDLVPKENACSYGWDPTKTHNADGTCAILADKPEPNANHGPGDQAGNSPNHGKGGQNILYNDGHTRWATTPAPDTPIDTDVYLGGKGYEKSTTDAKIIR